MVKNVDMKYEELIRTSKEFELGLNTEYRRNTGSYYTDLQLTRYMIDELFEQGGNRFIKNLKYKKFLEPCVGTGMFVFAYLHKIASLLLPTNETIAILENIYVSDINEDALSIYKTNFIQIVKILFEIELNDSFFNGKIARGLLFDITNKATEYLSIKNAFRDDLKFDIVITNPPYKNLKAESKQYSNPDQYKIDKKIYKNISNKSKSLFKFSNRGVLNLYKLFVEDIVHNYTNEKAWVSLLIPSSILTDKTCELLRSYLLLETSIKVINTIPENNPYIDASIALCTLLLNKGNPTKKINVKNNLDVEINQIYHEISIEDIENKSTLNSIVIIPKEEHDTLNKIRKFPKISDLDFIINMRGELDLSQNKSSILKTQTKFKLLRGKNISMFKLKDIENLEYVEPEFVDKSSKGEFISSARIACQQVSNLHKKKRVYFAYIGKDYVLGNSCNFIYVKPNKFNIDIFYLLGILNSNIINWYFKLFSSNNHINNYEIDNFPIPTNIELINKISFLVKQYLTSEDSDLLQKIKYLVNKAYELEKPFQQIDFNSRKVNKFTKLYWNDIKEIIPSFSLTIADEILTNTITFDSVIARYGIQLTNFESKVCHGITEKYLKLNDNQLLNHISFKLSDLDLEMIRYVPQGGNWKNIPKSTVQKSKRLIRISETGGRTTLYGRIDYSQPAYTITTYFNRPGNGTYVHPEYDRMISVREAARIQSFTDDYWFFGNKTSLLKQVGNAVPPLLAYQIGKQIIKVVGCKTAIDLFAGAGGLTAGLHEAGITTILGTDFDESACVTYKINNPSTETLCLDIESEEYRKQIIRIGKEKQPDIICGGPPCQGFSLAGKRFIDDPRNQLFKYFVDIISEVKPKVIILENVVGMMSFQKGAIYKQIIESFSDLGYETEGKILNSSKYGIPQKRKRVIILCTRKDLKIHPALLFPPETTPADEEQISVEEAIKDLSNSICGEVAHHNNGKKTSEYVKTLSAKIPFGSHLQEELMQGYLGDTQLSLL